MSKGKMGVLVIMIAIVGTLAGSWIISMDVEEKEVTKYNPLADITGVFQTSKVPDYVQYNPSTNYTGYYTTESIIDSVQYFDGVSYESSKPNNFRLLFAPSNDPTPTTTNLSTAISDPGTTAVSYIDTPNPPIQPFTAHSVTIQDLIDQLRLQDYDKIIFADTGTVRWSGDTSGQWITIIPTSWIGESTSDRVLLKNPTITPNLSSSYDGWAFHDPCMACVYDGPAHSVELFADLEMTTSIGIYAPSETKILYGRYGGLSDYSLGTQLRTTGYDFPDPDYMNPNAGVELI